MKVVGSNLSTVNWKDIFHIYLFEKTKLKEKEAGDGRLKKRFVEAKIR